MTRILGALGGVFLASGILSLCGHGGYFLVPEMLVMKNGSAIHDVLAGALLIGFAWSRP